MSESAQPISAAVDAQQTTLPWRRGLVWLMFLGPFFFMSYSFANWWTGHHANPGIFVFNWEKNIPFLAWTIVPYWMIDLFYGLSFLLCRDNDDVDLHAGRLLAVQLIAISCFLLFPLQFTFERPATDGLFGWMFQVLMGFDKPYNQAPSLHIALLVILWQRFSSACSGKLRLFVHGCALLIGISTLTTYQHHFIDLPTGALVGFLCLWLMPDNAGFPLRTAYTKISPAGRVALYYFLGALACAGVACIGGAFLWMIWPAVSLLMVALIYLRIGPEGFQKNGGTFSTAATWLLAPYLAGAWLNSRWWTRRRPRPVLIMDDVWLGRMPSENDMNQGGFASLLDLTAELPPPQGNWQTINLGWLDLLPVRADQLCVAATHIEAMQNRGKTLVCCALGYSRSVAAVSAWLIKTGHANSVDAAIAQIAVRHPDIKISAASRKALANLQNPGLKPGGLQP